MRKKDDLGFFEKIKLKISDLFYSVSVGIHNIFSGKNKKAKKVGSVSGEVGLADEKYLRSDKKKFRRRELLCIWSVLIIPLINLAIFWVYGTIQSFPIAFETYDIDGAIKGYDFTNFTYLFHSFTEPNSLFLQSIINNLSYWSLGFFVMTPISFITGFFLYKKIWGYRIFRYIFFFPSLMSSVVIAIFFKNLVGPNGQVQYIIEKLGGPEGILLLGETRFAMPTMLFYKFYTGLTGGLIYWLAAFARIPEEIVEAGKLDGLTFVKEFIYIAFPITWPFLATMLMLNFTSILKTNGATLLLTQGAYGTYDLGYYEYILTVSGSKADQALSGAMGLLKGLVVLPFTLVINHFVNKIEAVEF
ncbi:MAG: sugar ABC transporter permease [Clostridia bacterium]|nr:sugar ABC transporter permease [Clostridia bacterium]